MKEINAELMRTMKRKIKKESSLLLAPIGPKTRSGGTNPTKPKKPTKSASNLIDLTKSATPKQSIKPAQIAKPVKPSFIQSLEFTKPPSPPKLFGSKKGKETKRIKANEAEDSQTTLKNESEADASHKRRKVVLPPAADYNLFLVPSDSEDNEVTKHLKLLKDFVVHSETYRAITTEALGQLRPLLKANPLLRPAYDSLRNRNNALVEEQATLRGSLERIVEES